MRMTYAKRYLGQSIAEMPAAIFVLCLVALFPLLDLATIAIRSSAIYTAARNATHKAARASNFSTAVVLAKQTVRETQQGFSGVDIQDSDVKVFIVGTPLKAGLPPIRQQSPLAQPNGKDYVFQIEVVVSGRVQPLATVNQAVFNQAIPGVTGPLLVKSSCREFCERVRGLAPSGLPEPTFTAGT